MKNRKRLIAVLAGAMAALMLFTLIASLIPRKVNAATTSELQAQLDALEAQNDAIEAEMAALEEKMAANSDEIDSIVEQKNNIDQQITLTYTKIDNINDQIATYSLMIADKQDELDAAEARYAELNEKNRERIRAMEENGSLSYWSVIFQANSFADLLDRLNMIEEIAAADQRRLEEMNQAAKQVASAKEELSAQKEGLEATKAELDATQKKLDTKRAKADGLLSDLLDKQAELYAMMDEWLASQEAVSAEIAAKEAEYDEAWWAEYWATATTAAPESDSGGGSSSGGSSDDYYVPDFSGEGWLIPCNYVCVTDAYGWRIHPFTGTESFHSGIDLAGWEGTPIYASRSGVVTTATSHWSFGNYVTINHGDGYSSLYAHMTYFIVSEGEYVDAGEVIGYMGSTGESTGDHLHFSIYYDSSSVNPASLISFY